MMSKARHGGLDVSRIMPRRVAWTFGHDSSWRCVRVGARLSHGFESRTIDEEQHDKPKRANWRSILESARGIGNNLRVAHSRAAPTTFRTAVYAATTLPVKRRQKTFPPRASSVSQWRIRVNGVHVYVCAQRQWGVRGRSSGREPGAVATNARRAVHKEPFRKQHRNRGK